MADWVGFWSSKRWMVPLPTCIAVATSRIEAPASCISRALLRSKTTRLRPSCFPLCFALLIPALTRARISSRLNSATDAQEYAARAAPWAGYQTIDAEDSNPKESGAALGGISIP
jgi:hypothetical protein